jgi:hypothetical protein
MSKLLFCRGTVCAAAQADTAIAAFLFVTWITTVGLLAKDVFKSGFRKPTSPAGAGGPGAKRSKEGVTA